MSISVNTKESWLPVLEQARDITGFSEKDERLIRKTTEYLLPYAGEIADEFYSVILDFEASASILKEVDPEEKFGEKRLKPWIESLLRGNFDDSFWTWHWVIGLILLQHRINRCDLILLIGILQKMLIAKIFATFSEKSALPITLAFLNLTNCLSRLALKSYQAKFNKTLDSAGMKRIVFDRMISLEVKKELKHLNTLTV
ncbi:MAG: protoglobin domain-containing protein [Verrucomicrobiales bacterium]|nr:protoglobin domain-containing protein [Verrucomicrobiales bacterium]